MKPAVAPMAAPSHTGCEMRFFCRARGSILASRAASRDMAQLKGPDVHAGASRSSGGGSEARAHSGDAIVSALVVQMTLNFPGTILLETSLSFLGLGVQPPLTSLGLLLGSGRSLLLNAWWLAVFPGLVIFLTTLYMSLFGDWLRDRLDPTLSRQ